MLGASARYGVARWLPVAPGSFPWATFWTNLLGSFALGIVWVCVVGRSGGAGELGSRLNDRHAFYLRLFLGTGVIGAFTTMSTYAVETVLLLDDGHIATALAYGSGSLAGGLALAYAGGRLGRCLRPHQADRS
ncbi:MAG: fluoride exporter [Acidimicrobiia bacterium]|jgi:CrcB protein|nr:fluoride exporter [Acidimicrobiia bacterium]